MNRKPLIMLVLFVLFLIGGSVRSSAQITRVAIGYSGISADQLVIWVAKDTGIFAKNNLDNEAWYGTGSRPRNNANHARAR